MGAVYNRNIPSCKAHTILITLYFSGHGTVWFDNLQFFVNKQSVNTVPVAPPFDNDQLNVLQNHSFGLSTIAPTRDPSLELSEFKDMEPLADLIGHARILAVGESTHGTSEFFRFKHRFLQFAIAKLGVRVFVLEDNQLLTERVNRYVLEGEGTAESVMKGLFARMEYN